jgi:hypothetical protein
MTPDLAATPAPTPEPEPEPTPEPIPALAAPAYHLDETVYTVESVELEWSAVSNAEGYEVQRATSKDGPYDVAGTTEELTFMDKGLDDGADYFYRTRAYVTVSGERYYGEFSEVQQVTTLVKEPTIAFSQGSPILEFLYRNGFFYGSRINFNLIVIDDAGRSEIEIRETSGRNGKTISQTRVIQIDGPGTYPLYQEMWNGYAGYADRASFTYSVSACRRTFEQEFTGCYNSYNGEWNHYFGLR